VSRVLYNKTYVRFCDLNPNSTACIYTYISYFCNQPDDEYIWSKRAADL
jgi:hypothetical protein